MKDRGKRYFFVGILLILAFAILTWVIQNVDVKPLGVNGTEIGLATLNCMLHKLCGTNMTLYTVTDWLGLVPISVTAAFGIVGLVQLLKRRNLFKVDGDILVLGIYYIAVAMLYIVFEKIHINYRPILINGYMESSYPSSTTLLVMCVMPTLTEQISRRCNIRALKAAVIIITVVFSLFMVIGRLISGVHWFTDILGSALISMGLFCVYKGFVFEILKKA